MQTRRRHHSRRPIARQRRQAVEGCGGRRPAPRHRNHPRRRHHHHPHRPPPAPESLPVRVRRSGGWRRGRARRGVDHRVQVFSTRRHREAPLLRREDRELLFEERGHGSGLPQFEGQGWLSRVGVGLRLPAGAQLALVVDECGGKLLAALDEFAQPLGRGFGDHVGRGVESARQGPRGGPWHHEMHLVVGNLGHRLVEPH
mmetsp:Transcript_18747/g.59441  ORF Transcript_18747/g.59441 Transcript_18747/m.59441 type:complete len:200 (+) Transcript_18747:252-851(+)